jgi:hypothetical protein
MNALSPSPFLHPNGLVNLWDMLEIKAIAFVDAMRVLQLLQSMVHLNKFPNPEVKLGGKVKDDLLRSLESLRAACQALRAKLTTKAIDAMQRGVEEDAYSFADAARSIVGINLRFRDEVEECKLFGLSDNEASAFDETLSSFNFDVESVFGSEAAEDIDEAGKCLALDRNTACVFHLMRAMEQAVKVLGSKVGLTNIEIAWGKLLSAIDDKIKVMPAPIKDEWSECRANLYHVKQAWRNSTMHPKETYTNVQAKQVLDAVRAFMQQLVTLV